MDLMLIVFFIALLMILSGTVYKKLQNSSITEPFLALLLGLVIGPDVLNIIKSAPPEEELNVLVIACEFTIAMALMATALRLPQHFFRKNMLSLSNLTIGGMISMWLISAGIIYLVFNFSLVECLLLGAVITPTDPVVASTITTSEPAKKYLPSFIRNSLSFEAGVNDGLAYPIVFLSLLLTGGANFSFGEWTTRILLYENILCAVLAYLTGTGAGFIMKKAHKSGWMDQKTLLPFSLAVALLLLAGFNALNMNGIVAVFVGGYAFAQDITGNEDLKEEKVQGSMERLTTVPVFFILGLMLPWQEWFSLGWLAVVIAFFILFLRRIPGLLLISGIVPRLKGKFYSTALMGWFGPIGVASLYYAIQMKEKSGMEEAWIIPSLIVTVSTVVHGFTSVPLEKIYYNQITKSKEFPDEQFDSQY